MSLRERIGSELQALGYAMTRISEEMRDWRRERENGPGHWDAVVYVRPVTLAQRLRLEPAFLAAANTKPDPQGTAGGVEFSAGKRDALGFYCRVASPTADGASLVALTTLRRALANANVTVEELDCEVERRQ